MCFKRGNKKEIFTARRQGKKTRKTFEWREILLPFQVDFEGVITRCNFSITAFTLFARILTTQALSLMFDVINFLLKRDTYEILSLLHFTLSPGDYRLNFL